MWYNSERPNGQRATMQHFLNEKQGVLLGECVPFVGADYLCSKLRNPAPLISAPRIFSPGKLWMSEYCRNTKKHKKTQVLGGQEFGTFVSLARKGGPNLQVGYQPIQLGIYDLFV